MLPQKQEHEDYGTSFKMGVEFNPEDMDILERVIELMCAEINDDDFDVKSPHDDGKIFFKLATNKTMSEFTFESNVALKPSKLNNDKLEQFSMITLDILVAGWYMNNNDDGTKKYGLSLKVQKVWFGGEKSLKKRKKPVQDCDEDENININSPSSSVDQSEPEKKKMPMMTKADKKILKGLV